MLSARDLKPWHAVTINAVLFGCFHLSIFRFFPTALLGAMLALIVWRTRSIFPAMLFHLLNNAATIVIGRLLGDSARDTGASLLYLGLASTALAVGLYLATRSPAARPSPGRPLS